MNEETNPFVLWFDAPGGLVAPVVVSVDTFRWSEKRRDGLRVVANILTRASGHLVPKELHNREPYFQRAETWLAAGGRRLPQISTIDG